MPKNVGLSVGFLFDDTLDSTDGVAQHVKTLGAWLSRSGHEVSYLVGDTKMDNWAGGKVYSLSRNVSVTFNGNKLSMPAVSHKSAIQSLLAGKRFDVLHVMAPYSPLMSQRVINMAAAGTAIVGTFHVFPVGFLPRAGGRLLRLVYGRSLKRIDEMISVSRPAADFCRQSLGLESKIVPNPLDFTNYQQIAARVEDAKRVIFLGRLVKRKGAEELIKAFAVLCTELSGVELIIAGDGPQRQYLQKHAAELNVIDKVSFLGRIDESDKPRLLASADVACFPSLYGESFGLVLVEAMAAGAKTVLGGDNPGYRSVLSQQPFCLVNPKDTTFFAERLKKLLTDQPLAHKINEWQRRTVRQYDVEQVGPQVLEVYHAAIARLAKTSHNTSHG